MNIIIIIIYIYYVIVFMQGFVAYLKSVMMASNKKIFDVTQIDLDDFARLIRLLIQFECTVCRVIHAFGVVTLLVQFRKSSWPLKFQFQQSPKSTLPLGTQPY